MINTTIQVVKQENQKNNIQLQKREIKKQKIVCLDDPADDDLHKIYFIEFEGTKGKYDKIIATVFGATSCSCTYQTRNPYKSCNHMKLLDEILEQCPNKIQNASYTP